MSETNNHVSNSYLTFKLGEEEFGIHVNQVVNILEMSRIVDVPKTPEYMKGVINLRGKALPVIDTRLKFAMPEKEHTSNTCIIVLDLDSNGSPLNIGAIVDEVTSVIEIEKNQIEPPPNLGNKYQSDFIYGMAKIDERFVMLLDMQRVISPEVLENLSKNAGESIPV